MTTGFPDTSAVPFIARKLQSYPVNSEVNNDSQSHVDRTVSVELKGKVYGVETWASTKNEEERLDLNIMTILRCTRVFVE